MRLQCVLVFFFHRWVTKLNKLRSFKIQKLGRELYRSFWANSSLGETRVWNQNVIVNAWLLVEWDKIWQNDVLTRFRIVIFGLVLLFSVQINGSLRLGSQLFKHFRIWLLHLFTKLLGTGETKKVEDFYNLQTKLPNDNGHDHRLSKIWKCQ